MERFTNQDTGRAVDQAIDAHVGPFKQYGPVIDVLLTGANKIGAVLHGLGTVPDGMLVVASLGGMVRTADLSRWTDTTAFVVADVAKTRGLLIFVTFRKETIHA